MAEFIDGFQSQLDAFANVRRNLRSARQAETDGASAVISATSALHNASAEHLEAVTNTDDMITAAENMADELIDSLHGYRNNLRREVSQEMQDQARSQAEIANDQAGTIVIDLDEPAVDPAPEPTPVVAAQPETAVQTVQEPMPEPEPTPEVPAPTVLETRPDPAIVAGA